MPKVKKSSATGSQKRLYHGTCEKIAKLTPINGLVPFSVNTEEKAFSDVKLNINYLSDVYGGYMAYCSSDIQERWGIIEINSDKLIQTKLVAEDSLFGETKKRRSKKQILANERTSEQSLKEVGFCLYAGTIPADAIRRISIYNPHSNWFITKEVLHTSLGLESHPLNIRKHQLLTRWLMGEFVSLDDWLGDSPIQGKEKDEIQSALYERSGLDIFYHGDD